MKPVLKTVAAFALLTSFAAAPAAAVTYDAFTSFNGTNGNGGFSYGYTDNATLIAFDVGTTGASCALNGGSTCLYSSAQGNLPQASVGGSFSTVSVPADAVLVHPGNSGSLSVYSAFVAPVAGTYTYSIDLQSVGIDTTNGIGYTPFIAIGGVVTLGSRGTLPTYLSTASLTGSQSLLLGQSFGVIIDYNGVFFGDSTGVNFTISNVPEPATWALMIAGFGLVGVASRRRAALTA